MITEQDKEIIYYLQGDLPLESHPYKALAQKLGVREEELLKRLSELKERGVLRRIGAVVHHHRAGYLFNAMVCWQVEESLLEDAGQMMSRYAEVSHVYQRPANPPRWPYNLFSMIHGKSREECEKTAEKISRETGAEEYSILYSLKEYKKTSMKYFKKRRQRE